MAGITRDNFVGKKFHKLTVLERVKTDKGATAWLCLCECGNQKVLSTDIVRNERWQSCGCYRRVAPKLNHYPNKGKTRDLSGQRFGKLTCVSVSHQDDARAYHWKCLCDCGNETTIAAKSLLVKKAPSCGCDKPIRVSTPKPQKIDDGKKYITHVENPLVEFRTENLVGRKFGRLTCESLTGKSKDGLYSWACTCECGNKVEALGHKLTSGKKRSCGCLIADSKKKHGEIHREGGKTHYSKEYISWMHIKARCLNPKNRSYPDYGGRGITICKEWENDFEAFLAHVGRAPSADMTIDRINNETGNYEPGNVRWATRKQQNRNKRSNVMVVFNGKEMTKAEYCETIGCCMPTVNFYLKKGLSLEQIADKRKALHLRRANTLVAVNQDLGH